MGDTGHPTSTPSLSPATAQSVRMEHRVIPLADFAFVVLACEEPHTPHKTTIRFLCADLQDFCNTRPCGNEVFQATDNPVLWHSRPDGPAVRQPARRSVCLGEVDPKNARTRSIRHEEDARTNELVRSNEVRGVHSVEQTKELLPDPPRHPQGVRSHAISTKLLHGLLHEGLEGVPSVSHGSHRRQVLN
eukprot:CAMPEP_0194520844 /NCGR_PEP_ID=MMETSP0253-20130528/54981_1 /TAXON_ID=2966 /ORGANISM="Noctiluca scintillans" /LENGTH=188 /DNA_ID=CAMNT_0039365133 /DNA_START=385 /DNA_END=951 /DNA_ORIENTATION=-